MSAIALSGRRLEVYEFIKLYVEIEGRGPSLREIAKNTGYKHNKSAKIHVDVLEDAGLVKRAARYSPRIRLTEARAPTVLPKIFSRVDKDILSDKLSEEDQYGFYNLISHKDTVVLKFFDDTFIKHRIRADDYVIIHRTNDIPNNKLVLICFNGRLEIVEYNKSAKDISLKSINGSISKLPLNSKPFIIGVLISIISKL